MKSREPNRRLTGWRVATVLAAVALYAVAVSNTAYDVTSPSGLSYHEPLRKIYAVGAFTLLGWLFTRSQLRLRGFVPTAIVVGLYSMAIEVGQTYIDHSTESLAQHGFDIASGVFGGALGTVFTREFAQRREQWPGKGAALAISAAGLVVWFFAVYAHT